MKGMKMQKDEEIKFYQDQFLKQIEHNQYEVK